MTWRGGGGRPPFDCEIEQVGEAYPRGNISFVVKGGDDEFGARGDIQDK